jgi:site-specific recombinase XerD
MTLNEAAGRFLVARSYQGRANSTIVLYGKRLGQFIEWCWSNHVTLMREIDADVVEAFLATLRQGQTLGHHGAGGISQYYRILSSFLRWFYKRNKLGPSPIELTEPPPATTRQLPPVSVETVRALLKAADAAGSHTV